MGIQSNAYWKQRVYQVCYGSDIIDFAYPFTYPWIAIKGSTTNVNPRNVVGYFHQVVNVPVLGGKVEVGERFTLTNDTPKIIQLPDLGKPYYLRYKFASPVGNSRITIWEYTQPEESDLSIKLEEINKALITSLNRLNTIQIQLSEMNGNSNYRNERYFY